MTGSVLTCVAYHHFESAPTDATRHLGISTPPDVFRSHLDYHQLHFNVVGLDDVLSGDLDSVTSPTDAEEVTQQFPNATHIIIPNLPFTM